MIRGMKNMTKDRRTLMTQETIPRRPSANAPDDRLQNVEERKRQRAFELYEARDREEGHDMDDWLQAEAEIAGAKTQTTAA